MQIFLDTADPKEIEVANKTGMIDGITTNPTLATTAGVPFKEAIEKILGMVDGPVSLEVLSTDYDGMMSEAEQLVEFGENVVVKLPMLPEGVQACKDLSAKGIKVNMTLVFSTGQALMAAKAGAEYCSPFMGRHDDISESGIELIAEIRQLYDNYGFETKILAASERTARQVVEAALIGADVATVKYKNFMNLFKHPLTNVGLDRFMNDWKESGQEPLVTPK